MDMYDLICLGVVLATLAFVYMLILTLASEHKSQKEQKAYDDKVFAAMIEIAKHPRKVTPGSSEGVHTPYHWSEY